VGDDFHGGSVPHQISACTRRDFRGSGNWGRLRTFFAGTVRAAPKR
jgi:hypothetical protein